MGYLHLGHARNFWAAWRRARTAAGQLVLFRALGLGPPRYFHCPLLRDAHHLRLAKRHDSLSLRALRDRGIRAQDLQERFAHEIDWMQGLGAAG